MPKDCSMVQNPANHTIRMPLCILSKPEVPIVLCIQCFCNDVNSLACFIMFARNARKVICLTFVGPDFQGLVLPMNYPWLWEAPLILHSDAQDLVGNKSIWKRLVTFRCHTWQSCVCDPITSPLMGLSCLVNYISLCSCSDRLMRIQLRYVGCAWKHLIQVLKGYLVYEM